MASLERPRFRRCIFQFFRSNFFTVNILWRHVEQKRCSFSRSIDWYQAIGPRASWLAWKVNFRFYQILTRVISLLIGWRMLSHFFYGTELFPPKKFRKNAGKGKIEKDRKKKINYWSIPGFPFALLAYHHVILGCLKKYTPPPSNNFFKKEKNWETL